MPTHASLLHNLRILRECTDECDDTTTAVCFPTHFDVMGLVCHYLFVPLCGGTGYFMSPDTFTNSPSLWIQAISKYRGTFSIVPNSALDLAAAAVDDVPLDVDLSSLSFLGTGSESVSIKTMEKFYTKFSPYGLQEHSLRASYGLSEHTGHLCASAEEEDLIVERGHVGHGRPHHSVTVKIVDPSTHMEVMEGGEGEVWVHSESKAIGYWGKEKLSKEAFHAELVGDREKTYLRTGDMGFVRSGNVFVLGRCKDLVVVSGRKIYLNDVENRLESTFSELRPGRTAAVEWDPSLDRLPHSDSATKTQPPPRKGLAFFAELRNEDYFESADCHVLAERIAARIGLDFTAETLLVALLPLNAMPHTGSGKRQRWMCRANLLGGTLQVIHQWSPSTVTRESGTVKMIKPEFIPLPPTPIPSKPSTGRLPDRHLKQSPPLLHSPPPPPPPPPPSEAAPELNLETSPTSEEIAAVPRKESRFRLEDAPPPLDSQEMSRPPEDKVMRTPRPANHLDIPDADLGEKSRGLAGQERVVMDIIGRVLGTTIEMDTNIWSCGCNSARATQISGRLEQHLGFSVEAHLLYAYQTPRALLEKLKRTLLHLCSPVGVHSVSGARDIKPPSRPPPPLPCGMVYGGRSMVLPSQDDEPVIVSMACRLPGCDSPEELWQILTEKKVTVSSLREPKTGKLLHGGFTDRMANFDHKWFGISRLEASKMDPQQSVLLHTAWECLRRSGHSSPEEVRGSKIGVFIGFWGSDARSVNLASDGHPPCTSYIGALAANRISYVFDLKGPSMAIDTACAASLTALEIAVSYMNQGKCSQALVGGVNALLDPKIFEISSGMGVLSPTGESRVFDAEASGYVRGEGCGVVLLKRVGDALKYGNRLLAVVKSVESLHNGHSATLTAPDKLTQSRLLHTSLGNAMLGPSDLSYVEAHGTGTPLGDPIEISAIQEVFGGATAEKLPRVGPLIVGSIKANIGHLESASGIAGLIKTVLVLEHVMAPANPGLETVNPALKIDPDKILLPREMVSLDRHYMYRPNAPNLLSAGVNSFGIGGATASAVLQQYSQLPHLGQTECRLILCGEYGSVTMDQVMGSIQLLRARLRAFDSAYLSCVEAFQRAVKPVKVLASSEAFYHHPAYLMFCLLYSTARTLQAHDVELSFLMGTNLCAEVAVLALAEVLILSDAMRLLLAGMAPQVFNIKFIVEEEMQPTASFLSPTLNQLCLPGRFPPASLNQLICEIQRRDLMRCTCDDPMLAASLVSIANSGHGSLLAITLNTDSTVTRAVIKTSKTPSSLVQLHGPSLVGHIREAFLSLRVASDEMVWRESEGPSEEAVSPGFYERFPMRAAQSGGGGGGGHTRASEEGDERGGRDTSSGRRDSVKQKQQRLSLADESGYITRPTSAESLKSSTPAISPIKPQSQPLPSSSLSSQLATKSAPSVAGLSEKAIVGDILEFIRSELVVDLVETEREAEMMGLQELGLDSISMIELQDHVLQSFKVDIPLARMSELKSVREIVGEIARSCEGPVAGVSSDDDGGTKRDERGYYTIPSIECLASLGRDGLKRVPHFTVGRAEYGKVEFLGKMDVSGLDLRQPLMEITHCSIRPSGSSKSQLNRPALLFFENAFSPPPDGSSTTTEAADPVANLLQSLRGSACLVHSDPSDGQLVLKVDSFY